MTKKGFTLIELLVVISIIALLMAIMMPSLNKARNLAQRVVCKSNQKQIGMGVEMFTMDNNDWLPMADGTGIGSRTVSDLFPKFPHTTWWYKEIAPYMDYKNDPWFDGKGRPDEQNDNGDAPKVLVCPGFKGANAAVHGRKVLCYGWNWLIGAYYRRDVGDGDWWKPRKKSKLENHAVTALLGDSRTELDFDRTRFWGGEYWQIPGEYYYGKRHSDGCNYLCIDLHVEYASYDELVEDCIEEGPIRRPSPEAN
ncbi:PilD-dependent protein PddA [Limihaloglobus sulfuriphilus]|uniref:PilD-dependent protein PddA n=1 Tax=Limihaloglobus sulfuriphilus TaxID=1851148 RepID=A0A1Q2MEC8_9BACT|nr:type II secretion system protein [Limihaloglobus sulfuriphilus]AQQ71055.1 PilD-dependent protein PddA [Limihaloglobus sulfuriphilus]